MSRCGPVRALRPFLPALILAFPASAEDRGPAWARHTVDDGSRGADGVRLADVDGDGRPDSVTGWEEGGAIRLCLNPGSGRIRETWPAVTLGRVGSPEDAVLADLDGDGSLDVVSASEGNTKTLWVYWGPKDRAACLDPAAWTTEAFPETKGRAMWMFALPMQVDGRNGIDLVAGAKGKGAELGWFAAPERPRDLAGWRWHPLRDTGWIMSVVAHDMDGDGDDDIVFSDRKGTRAGVFWLEHPGPGRDTRKPWTEHPIGSGHLEPMFLDLADLDGDGLEDVVAADKGKGLIVHRRTPGAPPAWESVTVPLPPGTGTAKSAAVGDIDLDGRPDVVVTCENAKALSGVVWMTPRERRLDGPWATREISGPVGTKYDFAKLIDLDGDGDLDVLTCEEVENLGVIWYENPAR